MIVVGNLIMIMMFTIISNIVIIVIILKLFLLLLVIIFSINGIINVHVFEMIIPVVSDCYHNIMSIMY